MIKAVFFDVSDTLCDYRAAREAAVERACDYAVRHAEELSADGVREAYLRELRQAEEEARRWAASRRPEGGAISDYQPWQRALEKCGVANPILAHAVACHYELSRMRALRLLPHARSTLQALQGRVCTGVIAEGNPGIVHQELDLHGLRDLLAMVVVEAEAGYVKRDPQLYLHAVRAAGCEPNQAAFVGDSLEGDIAPARAAALVTVWVNPEEAQPDPAIPPDYTVRDLQAVPGLLLGSA